MDWLRRKVRPAGRPEAAAPEPDPGVSESAAPGIAELLEGLGGAGELAVLDLGPARSSNLEWYSGFARYVRFADLLGDGRPAHRYDSLTGRLADLPTLPGRPFDVILIWDTLDRLGGEDRARLVARLAELSGPGTRVHAIVRAPEFGSALPLRFSIVGSGRIRYEPVGGVPIPRPPIRPAELAPLVAPFRVVRGFTLRGGLREYVISMPEHLPEVEWPAMPRPSAARRPEPARPRAAW